MKLAIAIILISALFGFLATVIIFALIGVHKDKNIDEDEIWRGLQK